MNPNNNKTIMIIGGGQEHILAQETARSLGLSTFVTDGDPDAPGFQPADSFSVVSTYDNVGTLSAAREYEKKGNKISGVMTIASDVPFTVAYVAEALGLPGIGVESALNSSGKIRMKECFRKNKLPMPLFREVNNENELLSTAEELGFPVIVKPVDSRGARGVQLIKNQKELSTAYLIALEYSVAGKVMVEEYLDGPQLSTEGFILDGAAYIPAIFDRNYEYLERFKPFVVENGGEMPSIYSEKYSQNIHDLMRDAALALGIETGIIKGDLVIHEGQVKIIELAARFSGGFFGTVATPTSCGVDLIEANINLCMGNRIDPKNLDHKFKKAAAIRFAFPPPGRVKSVTGLDKVLQEPACQYAHVFVKEGDIIPPTTNHPSRSAVVVAEGNCLEEAVKNAKRMINMLHWEVESVQEVCDY